MRKIPLLLILLVLVTGAPRAVAQVDAELILEQDQFLRDEAIPVKVRVINRSGQTLKLGEGHDWITFTVEIPGRGPVESVGQPPLASPFELESAQQATREIDLQPWFEVSMPSRYSVTATVRIRQWNREVITKSKSLEVVRGAKLWEQEVGVPVPSGQPEVRRFVLQQANYRKQLKLYLRLSNEADSFAFKLLPLGPIVSFGQPQAQVDERSNLHVLFQTSARSFLYTEINPAGDVLTRHTYESSNARPGLRLNDVGKIVVAGGLRRSMPSDLPFVATSRPTDLPTDVPVVRDVPPTPKEK